MEENRNNQHQFSILRLKVPLTNDSKYQCVCEVPVQRQLDGVFPQLQSLDGLCKADKDVSGSQGKQGTDTTQ